MNSAPSGLTATQLASFSRHAVRQEQLILQRALGLAGAAADAVLLTQQLPDGARMYWLATDEQPLCLLRPSAGDGVACEVSYGEAAAEALAAYGPA